MIEKLLGNLKRGLEACADLNQSELYKAIATTLGNRIEYEKILKENGASRAQREVYQVLIEQWADLLLTIDRAALP